MTVSSETAERFLPSVDRLEAVMHAARRAFERGDTDEARRQLEIARRMKPEYDAAWLLLGHVLRQSGDREGALDAFAHAVRINGESGEAWLGLAAVLHDLGRPKEEIDAYDRILKFDPKSIEAWIDKGAALHELEDYGGAVACYDHVLSMRPEHAAAWNNKGAALLRLDDPAGAARCVDEALHLDPDFFDAMANRVFLYQKRRRHGEVALWADRALRRREAPWLWYVKGIAHLALSESTLAMKAFERALALDPKMKRARAGLGKATALRQMTDFYRGVYECFGTHLPADPGCEECEIRARCWEVTP